MLRSYANNLLYRRRNAERKSLQKEEEETQKRQKQEVEIDRIRMQMQREEDGFMSKEWCDEFLKYWTPIAHGLQ